MKGASAYIGYIFLLLSLNICLPVYSETESKMFGHDIKVVKSSDDENLMVDGKSMVKDEIVTIERFKVVGGVGILIGGASGGGNACDVSPFIVSFPKNEPVKVDGPLDQCGMGEMEIGANQVVFTNPPLPNLPGHRYIWTTTAGFQDAGAVNFTPDRNSGWDSLRHDLATPLDLYKNSEVNSAIKALTKSDDDIFTNGFLGASSGEFTGDLYVGSGCVPHDCPFAGSFVIADQINRKVYLAWKEENKPFVVRPVVSVWPGPLRSRLKEWTKRFD